MSDFVENPRIYAYCAIIRAMVNLNKFFSDGGWHKYEMLLQREHLLFGQQYDTDYKGNAVENQQTSYQQHGSRHCQRLF
jgi:hypothetical protein